MNKVPVRRLLVMCLGIFIISFGTPLLRISGTGNDPFTALLLAVSERTGLSFSVIAILGNLVCFFCQIAWGRSLIGVGTFLHWFCSPLLFERHLALLDSLLDTPDSLPMRLVMMLAALLLITLGTALYQTADLGTLPYDAVSLIMDRRMPLRYLWCRILTDGVCAVAALLCGGLISIGTLVCAVGLGPFIGFFSRTVAQRLCGEQ